MSKSLEEIKREIETCSEEQLALLRKYIHQKHPHPLERHWGIDSDTILSAISRSSDLTKRGVRGIIAEAVFVNEIVPTVSAFGWKLVEIDGDQPYDALLENDGAKARIQVKLQRLEKGAPKLYYPKHYQEGTLFVVEVQKTRTGEKSIRKTASEPQSFETEAQPRKEKTRPYSFADFDILAVNMHPSSADWKNFRYTVASWLLPRQIDESLIEIFQPVAAKPNNVWTADLATCLDWMKQGASRKVISEIRHRKSREKK